MSQLPPGQTTPIISSLQLIYQPYEIQTRLREQYGDIFTVKVWDENLVFTASPEGAKQIFGSNPVKQYRPYGNDILGPFLGKRSVFLLSGKQHRKERSIIMPPFARSRMSNYSDLIVEACKDQAATWHDGKEIVMMDEHLQTTLTIILRAVFGVHEGERMEQYRERIAQAVDSVKPWLMFFTFLQRDFGGFGPWAEFQKQKGFFDDLLYEEVEKRRASDEELGDDVLSILVQSTYDDGTPLDTESCRDHLVSLLIAGHETTSIALSNAFYRLHRSPHTLAKLREELDELGPEPSVDEIVNLPYLEAVCNETLRLVPIVPAVARILRAPMELHGWHLPEGTAVSVAIGAIHHNPEIYPNPMEFRPERFIETRYLPHQFMPFGGGHRRCVGATLAMHEMKLVLAELLKNWEFELLEPHKTEFVRRNVTIAPSNGVKCKVVGRRMAN
jgi:cytochrome P450